MYTTYILYSATHDRYYIGQTNNIDDRLERHNKGYVRSTRPYRPWHLVYGEKFESRSAAMRRESHLKSIKSKVAIKS